MPISESHHTGAALDDSRRRRWHLLIEALKTLPMREALETVRAAEAFIMTGISGHASDLVTSLGGAAAGSDEAQPLVHHMPNGYLH